MHPLIYTFQSFKNKESLKKVGKVFVFGKLKEDWEVFKKIIQTSDPALIVGIARKARGLSEFEALAVNKFNNGVVLKGGKEAYELYIPSRVAIATEFCVNNSPHITFCNWTAYKVSGLLKRENRKGRVMFVHLRDKDLKPFTTFLNSYYGVKNTRLNW